jgi:hypothetical protein
MTTYDLIICVYGCNTIKKYNDQIIKINETWGKKCQEYKNIKLLYFLGETINPYNTTSDYIYLPNIQNDYLSASYKQYLGLKYIYDNYKTKYIICCGTDTYLNIPKLLNFINKFDSNDNLYIGGHGCNRSINNKNIYFHSGGPGFIITYPCLSELYPYLENIMKEWPGICINNKSENLIAACDVGISYYLQLDNMNTKIIKTNDLSFIHCNYKGVPCHINEIDIKTIISCHSMSLNDFDEFTKLLIENDFFI